MQLLDETGIFKNLNISLNLTESGIDNTDIESPIAHQFRQEMKKSGCMFGKTNSMILCLHKTARRMGQGV